MGEVNQGGVLLVEDTAALARTYLGYLRDEPFCVRHAADGAQALALFEAQRPDVVLLDIKLPDMDGYEVLSRLKVLSPNTPVVVITAHGSYDGVVRAMSAGAANYLVKPFSSERLVAVVTHLMDGARLARGDAAPPTEEPEGVRVDGYEGFIGVSPAMRAVYRAIERAAKSSATVFITGESGTGKEVCAEAVHNRSPRRKAKFVPINCAAIPGELMESEIFGHVRGAFTGAVADKLGAAKLADGGTLFLDEICEMSLHLQTKLLRFIQTGAYNPVGKASLERVDVRFICATNRDPLKEVREGRFREDLYYRLHVIPMTLPPLRERGEDIIMIAERLLAAYSEKDDKAFTGFDAEAKAALMRYGWPGNVRQLQNIVRNAVVLNEGSLVRAEMLHAPMHVGEEAPPPALRPETAVAASANQDIAELSRQIRPLADVMRESIERAVDLCGGDVRKAAVLLDVSPATIYRKQKAWREGRSDG